MIKFNFLYSNYEVNTVTYNSKAYRMIWQYDEKTNDMLRVGTTATVSFLKSGTNMKSYSVPNNLQFKWISAITSPPNS
jgi:hypothetical protein